VTLFFVDERQFLTVIQPVLPLYECADPAPTESMDAESAADPTHVESTAAADLAPAESSAEPLHSTTSATPTETS
jgi:hypothetical protein